MSERHDTLEIENVGDFWRRFHRHPEQAKDLVPLLHSALIGRVISLLEVAGILMDVHDWKRTPDTPKPAGLDGAVEKLLLEVIVPDLTSHLTQCAREGTPPGNCINPVLDYLGSVTINPHRRQVCRDLLRSFLVMSFVNELALEEQRIAKAAIKLDFFELLPIHYLPTLYGLLSDWMVKKGLSRPERLSCRGWARWLRDGEQVPEGLPKDVRRAIVARNRTFRRCIMRARPRVAADQRQMFRACAIWDTADMPSATGESARPWLIAKTMLAWLLRIDQAFHNLGIPAN